MCSLSAATDWETAHREDGFSVERATLLRWFNNLQPPRVVDRRAKERGGQFNASFVFFTQIMTSLASLLVIRDVAVASPRAGPESAPCRGTFLAHPAQAPTMGAARTRRRGSALRRKCAQMEEIGGPRGADGDSSEDLGNAPKLNVGARSEPPSGEANASAKI